MPDSQPASIETTANFANSLHRGFRVPNQYSAKHPDDLKTLGSREHIVVHNARLLDPAPTLASHGFQLVTAPTQLDLLNNDIVRNEFYAQCRDLLKSVTGCHEVRGGGHEYRNGFGGETGPRGVKPTPNGSGGAYAQGIHADMSPAVEKGFRRIVPDDRHFESINIWRSATPETVRMMPLAVCDMRSVRIDDIVFGDGQNTGNIKQYTKVVDQRLIHGPHQRWYYFPVRRKSHSCASNLTHKAEPCRMPRACHPRSNAAACRMAGGRSICSFDRHNASCDVTRRVAPSACGIAGGNASGTRCRNRRRSGEAASTSLSLRRGFGHQAGRRLAGPSGPRATAVGQEDPLGVPAVHGPERRQAGPVAPRPYVAKNRKAKRETGPKSRSAEKLSEQLSRRRIITRRRGTGCAANRSLRAVHRWQRRCAERPDNAPPRERLGVREDAGGFCQLQGG